MPAPPLSTSSETTPAPTAAPVGGTASVSTSFGPPAPVARTSSSVEAETSSTSSGTGAGAGAGTGASSSSPSPPPASSPSASPASRRLFPPTASANGTGLNASMSGSSGNSFGGSSIGGSSSGGLPPLPPSSAHLHGAAPSAVRALPLGHAHGHTHSHSQTGHMHTHTHGHGHGHESGLGSSASASTSVSPSPVPSPSPSASPVPLPLPLPIPVGLSEQLTPTAPSSTSGSAAAATGGSSGGGVRLLTLSAGPNTPLSSPPAHGPVPVTALTLGGPAAAAHGHAHGHVHSSSSKVQGQGQGHGHGLQTLQSYQQAAAAAAAATTAKELQQPKTVGGKKVTLSIPHRAGNDSASDDDDDDSSDEDALALTDSSSGSGAALAIASVSLLATGILNSIYFKKMTNAMPNYPWFLSQLSTIVYVPVFFGLVFWNSHKITPEMRAFPTFKFFIMGAFDSLSGLLALLGGVHTSCSLQALLSNAIIPFTMVLAYLWASERFTRFQVLGAAVILLGVGAAMIPTFAADDGTTPGGAGGSSPMYVLLYVLNNVPSAVASVYKEVAFADVELDVNYLQAWVALWQLLFGFALIPVNTLPFLGADRIPFNEMGSAFMNGLWCLLGYNHINEPKCVMPPPPPPPPRNKFFFGGGRPPTSPADADPSSSSGGKHRGSARAEYLEYPPSFADSDAYSEATTGNELSDAENLIARADLMLGGSGSGLRAGGSSGVVNALPSSSAEQAPQGAAPSLLLFATLAMGARGRSASALTPGTGTGTGNKGVHSVRNGPELVPMPSKAAADAALAETGSTGELGDALASLFSSPSAQKATTAVLAEDAADHKTQSQARSRAGSNGHGGGGMSSWEDNPYGDEEDYDRTYDDYPSSTAADSAAAPAGFSGGRRTLPVCDQCSGSWVPVFIYLAVNMLYNYFMVVIIKLGGASLLYVIMTLRLPLVQLAMSIPAINNPPDAFGAAELSGLALILAGLGAYKYGDPPSSTADDGAVSGEGVADGTAPDKLDAGAGGWQQQLLLGQERRQRKLIYDEEGFVIGSGTDSSGSGSDGYDDDEEGLTGPDPSKSLLTPSSARASYGATSHRRRRSNSQHSRSGQHPAASGGSGRRSAFSSSALFAATGHGNVGMHTSTIATAHAHAHARARELAWARVRRRKSSRRQREGYLLRVLGLAGASPRLAAVAAASTGSAGAGSGVGSASGGMTPRLGAIGASPRLGAMGASPRLGSMGGGAALSSGRLGPVQVPSTFSLASTAAPQATGPSASPHAAVGGNGGASTPLFAAGTLSPMLPVHATGLHGSASAGNLSALEATLPPSSSPPLLLSTAGGAGTSTGAGAGAGTGAGIPPLGRAALGASVVSPLFGGVTVGVGSLPHHQVTVGTPGGIGPSPSPVSSSSGSGGGLTMGSGGMTVGTSAPSTPRAAAAAAAANSGFGGAGGLSRLGLGLGVGGGSGSSIVSVGAGAGTGTMLSSAIPSPGMSGMAVTGATLSRGPMTPSRLLPSSAAGQQQQQGLGLGPGVLSSGALSMGLSRVGTPRSPWLGPTVTGTSTSTSTGTASGSGAGTGAGAGATGSSLSTASPAMLPTAVGAGGIVSMTASSGVHQLHTHRVQDVRRFTHTPTLPPHPHTHTHAHGHGHTASSSTQGSATPVAGRSTANTPHFSAVPPVSAPAPAPLPASVPAPAPVPEPASVPKAEAEAEKRADAGDEQESALP